MPILPVKQNTKKSQIILVTQDYSGLGFAKLSADAGYPTILAHKPKDEEENMECFDLVGEGIVEKMDLEELLKNKSQYRDAYFIWDQNHNYEIADKLRKEGFKVFGGSELMDKMEHDRNFGVSLVKKAGLETPPTFEFSDIKAGLEFLDKNDDKAYVFKPDDGSAGCFTTYVPDSVKPEAANRELYDYMISQEGEAGTYILQERIDGVETNFEAWVFEGKPFFSFCCLESKRKLNNDEGEMVGCAHDIAFTVPLDTKGVQETVLKLLKLPEFKEYTGFVDMNVIVAEKSVYFLEFCARFGYNSHPNLFINLAMKSFPELMVDFMDGDVWDFYKNFRDGFGASITLYIDHPGKSLPIYITEEMEGKFFHFDTCKKDDKYFLSGYANEVGIVCSHKYDIKSAGKQCLLNTEKITYPNHACRTDLDKEEYESSPYKRHVQLTAMHYV